VSRARTILALVSVAGLVSLAPACGSSGPPDQAGPDPVRPHAAALAHVATFALALGVDPLDRAALDRLGRYDLVVVDGATSAARVASLQRRGALVLGYLSVGTVEPYRPWYAEAKRQGWLLERYDDWDEWYADTSAPGLRSLLVGQARTVLAAGFDGLFLDNTDMVAEHPHQRAGMATLVASLDRLVGRRLLFAQNGDSTVGTIAAHLDGWNREDVSSTYDFDHDRYAPVANADSADAVATLHRLRARGLLVTATDYTASARSTAVTRARSRACRAGALPFASDIDLRRITAEPERC